MTAAPSKFRSNSGSVPISSELLHSTPAVKPTEQCGLHDEVLGLHRPQCVTGLHPDVQRHVIGVGVHRDQGVFVLRRCRIIHAVETRRFQAIQTNATTLQPLQLDFLLLAPFASIRVKCCTFNFVNAIVCDVSF